MRNDNDDNDLIVKNMELEIEQDRMMIRDLRAQLEVTVIQAVRIRERQNRIKEDIRKWQRELSKHERRLERKMTTT